jgi:hypothetical protein
MEKEPLILWRCPISHAHDALTAPDALAGQASLFCGCNEPMAPVELIDAA